MEANRVPTESIRELLHAFDPGSNLLHAVRPAEGLANEVFFLRTSRSGADLVLKVFDDEVGAWKPQKDLAINALMRDLDIPAPAIRLVDTSKRVVPFTYSLSDRITGEALSRALPSLSVEDTWCIYTHLGDCLGRLHATTFDRFGDVRRENSDFVVGPAHELGRDVNGHAPGPFATWLEMHRAIVEHRLNLMRGTAFEDLVPRIACYFEKHDGEIDFEIAPRLLHMDLHPGNILIRDGRIAGILDVEESIVGHNEYDLMRTELGNFRGHDPAYERAFKAAYTAHVPLDEGYPGRKRFYDLSRTLAWIRSLILHRDGDITEQAIRDRQAARSHLLGLVSDHQEC
ncbi:MAG: phosphotransferase [Chloroflexia bacterium]|nr:phosphotransferase [Chloroflexia bacterium]